MMKRLMMFIIFIFVLSDINAVLINQVLYDPKNTEIGGESIELLNNNSFDEDIGEWYITTEKIEKDVIIPKNTVLKPNQYYLIADKGWNESKDNNLWKNADHEETITLSNEDSGIMLKDKNGIVMDKLAWGKEPPKEFFNEKPANKVKEGNSLTRINITGKTQLDFKETTPFFILNNEVVLQIKIPAYENIFWIKEDDNTTTKTIEISPKENLKKTITILSKENLTETPIVKFLDKIDKMALKNKSYEFEIELDYWMKPQTYYIEINYNGKITNLNFEYLPLRALNVLTKNVAIETLPDSEEQILLELKNTGNVDLQINFETTDLISEIEDKIQPLIFRTNYEISAGHQKQVFLPIKIPKNIRPGEYKGILKPTIY